MLLRISLVIGITYFGIATYGGSYYVGPAMMCALLFWLYHSPKKTSNGPTDINDSALELDDSERGKHIRASRKEALIILESGDFQGAFSCMCTELMKHPETREHEFIALGMAQLIDGSIDNVDKMRCCLGLFK